MINYKIQFQYHILEKMRLVFSKFTQIYFSKLLYYELNLNCSFLVLRIYISNEITEYWTVPNKIIITYGILANEHLIQMIILIKIILKTLLMIWISFKIVIIVIIFKRNLWNLMLNLILKHLKIKCHSSLTCINVKIKMMFLKINQMINLKMNLFIKRFYTSWKWACSTNFS